MKPVQPMKKIEQKIILEHSKYLTVEEHVVALPDGQVIRDWPWIITPDFINAVVMTEAGQFVFFHQTKYCVDGVTLAPVGGYLEPGEDPLEAAKRELLEEAGYEAPEWTSLGHYCVDGNRGVATAYLYLAQGARQVTQPDADDLEEQELLLLSRDEVESALKEGQFKVLPWAAVVALALHAVPEK